MTLDCPLNPDHQLFPCVGLGELTLSSTINQRNDIPLLSNLDHGSVHPSSRWDTIETSDDDIETLVEGLGVILDLHMVAATSALHIEARA
jgi:hypothetical protein